MLGKFCVFCGKKPKNKNKEHVIPYWLLELTGRPTRSVILGVDWRNPKGDVFRRFSFSSFTFPACAECNSPFSALEERARQIILDMLEAKPIRAADLDALLDWLDKVRIGLWLGLMYLNGNMHNIKPMFYIKQRMAAQDRMVAIYRDGDPARGVMWAGADSPIFHVMPSCISLVINHLHLFNATAPFLFAPRMGFPGQVYPMFRPEGPGEYYTQINQGTGQVEFPLVPYTIESGGTQLYQPMIPRIISTIGEDIRTLYDNGFIRDRCLDYSSGRGKIFRLEDGRLDEYPNIPSLDWLPPLVMPKDDLLQRLPLQTMRWLEAILLKGSPSLAALQSNRREFVLQHRNNCLALHRQMVEMQEEANRRCRSHRDDPSRNPRFS